MELSYNSEQLKAAYALNLCTVSVSQIIDYDDINVMEQEYEGILNNLNLEQMPKDEALLKILKQIMDTITYFRIQDGEKKMVEKKYQQKMKNAIWAAAPKIGMIVTGGSPLNMAVSLASQVGIAYMNYRGAKADADLNRELEQWQLERTAIEQFNGLRRELFDTAWRLSAAHNFPDQLRLTERQIKQYNSVLMDSDLIRRYERLNAVKEEFLAYPPFWYQFGNTANSIARSDIPLSESTRKYYLESARSHFTQYRTANRYGLLREDPIAASCALELAELLDAEKDRELILELLQEAIRFSGRENDVMQLAALDYLKLNEREKAAVLLSQLVNEQYNTTLNAQILSSIYVCSYIHNRSEKTLARYEILCRQVGSGYLYPLPQGNSDSPEALENQFVAMQKKILYEKYKITAQGFLKKYMVKFGKIIPVYDSQIKHSDMYYIGDELSLQDRKYQALKIFSSRHKTAEYLDMLREANIAYSILDLLNEMFDACCYLNFMNEPVKAYLAKDIEEAVRRMSPELNDLRIKLEDDASFDRFAMDKLLELSLQDFTEAFFRDFSEEIGRYINSRSEMQDFALAEENLTEFCRREHLPDPAVLFGKDGSSERNEQAPSVKRFDGRLLGDSIISDTEDASNIRMMTEVIRSQASHIVLNSEKAEIFTSGDPRIERYFTSSKLRTKDTLKASALAILDNTARKADFDLIFTASGIVPVKNGSAKTAVAYKDIDWAQGKSACLMIGGRYEPEGVDLDRLYKLIEQLADYARPELTAGTGFSFPEIKLPFVKK